jgi:nitrogen fixation-related uncharacterized protein
MDRRKQVRTSLRWMKACWALGAFMLVSLPGTAFAHDALGDDELAVANWMLIGAMITIVIGALWGLWAWRSGQFHNVEESKYTMLEHAEDFDAIMAESDAREAALKQADAEAAAAAKGKAGTKAANIAGSTTGAPAGAAAERAKATRI